MITNSPKVPHCASHQILAEATTLASCIDLTYPAQAGKCQTVPKCSRCSSFVAGKSRTTTPGGVLHSLCIASKPKLELAISPASRTCPVTSCQSTPFTIAFHCQLLLQGLIMLAKSYYAFYDMQLQLHLGTFGREYTSLAHGWLAPSVSSVTTKARCCDPSECRIHGVLSAKWRFADVASFKASKKILCRYYLAPRAQRFQEAAASGAALDFNAQVTGQCRLFLRLGYMSLPEDVLRHRNVSFGSLCSSKATSCTLWVLSVNCSYESFLDLILV